MRDEVVEDGFEKKLEQSEEEISGVCRYEGREHGKAERPVVEIGAIPQLLIAQGKDPDARMYKELTW